MPPPHDGNIKLSFVDLMRLEKIDDATYRSIALPFMPGGPVGLRRSYGGHVYAQATWAACQTVGKGFLVHNVSGNFILGGIPYTPYIYRVQTIRNGRSFKTRIVNVSQRQPQPQSSPATTPSLGKEEICFTCTVSFQTPEPSYLSSQVPKHLWSEYASVLRNQHPTDFPSLPSMDVPWYLQRRLETGINDEFPGLESHRPDMTAYNASRHPLDRRQLIFYRPTGSIPLDEPNLHLCAHLYASDRNSLYIVAKHFDIGDMFSQMSSLVHGAVFHSDVQDLLFRPSSPAELDAQIQRAEGGMQDAECKWFATEIWSTRIGGGRGMFNGRVWSANGEHALSLTQDGMIRLTRKAVPDQWELEKLRGRERGWKKLATADEAVKGKL